MKRKTLIAAVVAVMALGAVPLVYAQQHGFHGHRGGDMFGAGMMIGHLAHAKDELGLSDQQVDQLKAIMASVHEQNAQYRDSLHGGLISVAEILVKNPNDLQAAQARLDQQNEAERAMKANVLAGVSKDLNVLTAEQRAKVGAKLAEHAARSRD